MKLMDKRSKSKSERKKKIYVLYSVGFFCDYQLKKLNKYNDQHVAMMYIMVEKRINRKRANPSIHPIVTQST